MDRGNECDVRSWTGAMETSCKVCWLCTSPVPPTRLPLPNPPSSGANMSLISKDSLFPPLCSQTSVRRRYGGRAEQRWCWPVSLFTEDVREGEFHNVVCMNERHVRRWCGERRWHTCGEDKGEAEEVGGGNLSVVGKRVKLVDTGQSGHRAHHCKTHKPAMTGHRRWYTHT